MAITLFKKVDYSVSRLIDEIETGEIGLPDIQRPFVWTATKVRNLFDSMYQGFPVGYLLFWSSTGATGVRPIGESTKQSPPRLLIVDGQQRLTSLYAVLRGVKVLTDDYEAVRINIAFRPRDGQFAVADPAVRKDPEFIPDITEIWTTSARRAFEAKFIDRLRAARTLSAEEEERLYDAIDRVYDLQNYSFTAMELSPQIDEEQVAEVFVRINSEGVQLNQDDFILTLMSVFWEEGRVQLEQFSRASRRPSVGSPSPFNHFIQPEPGQLLRVAVGLGFRRGALRHVYSLLRGRDLSTGQFSPEQREKQFAVLKESQASALDLSHWHEFLKVLIRAGFRSGKMITSKNALLYAYVFYLLGRRDYGVEAYRLRQVIARWYFMTSLTSRYSSSPESRVEQDLALLPKEKDADAFVRTLDRIVDQTLTPDFWSIALPNALATSSARSPELFAYYAALILLDAKVLFSPLRVAELFDPAIHGNRAAIERHHLFPRAYLATIGRATTKEANQIANQALLEWPDNAIIGARPPSEYFPPLAERLSTTEFVQARDWHALPPGWEHMEYEQFLEQRRRLIAQVIREGFKRLSDEAEPSQPNIEELIAEGEGHSLEFKETARFNRHTAQRDAELEYVIVKAVAGFANATGGTLLIGVNDEGQPIGLDDDLRLVAKPDVDRYELWLRDLLETALGKVVASGIQISFPTVAGKALCRIDVPASGQPVYANRPKSAKTDDFFVRIGNSTRKLTPQETVDYIEERSIAVPA